MTDITKHFQFRFVLQLIHVSFFSFLQVNDILLFTIILTKLSNPYLPGNPSEIPANLFLHLCLYPEDWKCTQPSQQPHSGQIFCYSKESYLLNGTLLCPSMVIAVPRTSSISLVEIVPGYEELYSNSWIKIESNLICLYHKLWKPRLVSL